VPHQYSRRYPPVVRELIRSPRGRLKLIGAVEAVSFLLLLGVAMPLKYLADMPEAVRIVGMAHGVLWLLYLVALVLAWIHERWSFGVFLLGVVASVIPFGPFIFDKLVLNREKPA
jgi:integral membrane protein